MKWLRALFGGGAETTATRHLSHPDQLRAGDIIKFKFMDLSETSGTQFEVLQVNTNIYGQLCYPELVLKDRDGVLLYVTIEDEDGEEYLSLCKKIGKAKMQDILSPTDIKNIQTKGIGVKITPTIPAELQQWLTNQYTEVEEVKGAFVKGDARSLSDAELKQRDPFTSYLLESDDEEWALELEVYDSGEMELCATRYFDLEEIEEMWPQQPGA